MSTKSRKKKSLENWYKYGVNGKGHYRPIKIDYSPTGFGKGLTIRNRIFLDLFLNGKSNSEWSKELNDFFKG